MNRGGEQLNEAVRGGLTARGGLLRLLLLLLSAAHATPMSVACASVLMVPAPTAVEGASGNLLRAHLLLLAAHATPLSVAWLRELLGFSVAEGMLQPPPPLEFELRRAC